MNIAAQTIRCYPPDGIDGRNICVAVLDTGICPLEDFSVPKRRILCFKDFVNGRNSPYDDNGHGTHVCGILGGSGKMSGGMYKGIAPACNIVMLKILDEYGSGTVKWTYDAINWLIRNKDIYNIRVINMSVGSSDRSVFSALSSAAEELWKKDMVVCAAGGNNDPYGVTAPGINRNIITVGSWDERKMYRIKEKGNVYFKPDVFAPGKDIVSCMADDFSFAGGRRKKDNMVGRCYIKMSGSSMSTPMVSAAAALIMQKNPHFTPDKVKEIIVSSSIKNNGKRLLNIEEALKG